MKALMITFQKVAAVVPTATRVAMTVGATAATLIAIALSLHAAELKKSFDVPAGSARQTLKQFAAQAGCEIVFSSDGIGTVQTNAVQGDLPVRDALDRMLEATGLVATQEQKSGAFAVRRKPGGDPEKNAPGPAARRRAVKADGDANEGETVALSPFNVTTTQD